MKQYKVTAAYCVCADQKAILKAGQIVPASFFNTGQAETLVEKKFIEPTDDAPDEEAAPAEVSAESDADGTNKKKKTNAKKGEDFM